MSDSKACKCGRSTPEGSARCAACGQDLRGNMGAGAAIAAAVAAAGTAVWKNREAIKNGAASAGQAIGRFLVAIVRR